MEFSFARQVHQFISKPSSQSGTALKQLLVEFLSKKLSPKGLTDYQLGLLFLIAHPPNQEILKLAEQACAQIAKFCLQLSQRDGEKLANTGLPFTPSIFTMSHDLANWMIKENNLEISIESVGPSTLTLNDVLNFTLPPTEGDITSAGYNYEELLTKLRIDKKNEIRFIVSQFDQLENLPKIKDYFFDSLEMLFRITPKTKSYSKLFNRLPVAKPFLHATLKKKIVSEDIIYKKIPAPKRLIPKAKKELVGVIKHSLNMFQRETDPVTYLDEKSLRYFELERGLSIAIYGMQPKRQFPLESYVGYTVLKMDYQQRMEEDGFLGSDHYLEFTFSTTCVEANHHYARSIIESL
ncbi:MAG: hypothetical protein HC811_12970 [Flammeovirgaceae bacterium]|nr:hypothetical protein [Flammeovirgaceae bacterium]